MPDQATGVIHDLGYRRYDGPRLGRAQIVRALTWHSFRSAWGIGRGVKAKILPILAIVAICLPAIANAFAVSRGNARLFGYDVYTPQFRVIVVTIFLAAQAPELVSRDLRSRVLPLYFSGPLREDDYPLAKYLALTGALLVLLELPLLILYVGTIASAKNSTAVWDETKALIPGLAMGLVWAVLMAAIGLVLAALLHRLGRSVALRSVILAPYLIANVIAAILWFWMLDPLLGFCNATLHAIGFGTIAFFSDQRLALPTIAAVNIWRHMGFVALLFYTGIQGIPVSIYEAARIEGAGPWKSFWHLTLPLLRPTMVFVLVTSVIGSFQVFDSIAVTTLGGPENSTCAIVWYI